MNGDGRWLCFISDGHYDRRTDRRIANIYRGPAAAAAAAEARRLQSAGGFYRRRDIWRMTAVLSAAAVLFQSPASGTISCKPADMGVRT